MKLINNTAANVEMIPAVVYLFILSLILFVLAYVVAPITTIVRTLQESALDPSGSLYMDVASQFDTGLKMWYFLLVMIIAVKIFHIGLLAIRKQRYEGGNHESEF